MTHRISDERLSAAFAQVRRKDPGSTLALALYELEQLREVVARLGDAMDRMQREQAYSDADCVLSELKGILQEYRL